MNVLPVAVVNAIVVSAIIQAVDANKTAQTFEQWRNGGATPELVFKEVAELGTPLAWQSLCKKLSELPNDDLALFEHQIFDKSESGATKTDPLKCRSMLTKRLALHWQTQAEYLDFVRDAELRGPHSNVQLPNVELRVDSRATHQTSDGGLKAGEIALTFDDGPHPTRTARVLEILKAAGVRATFFDIGENAITHKDVVKATRDAFHAVGSHGWNHANLAKLGYASAKANLERGHKAVMEAAGEFFPFFRFPYGARTKRLQKFIGDNDLTSFFWNMDSLDWKLRDPLRLWANIIAELDREKGGIILFHDIHEQTVLVLPHFLEELQARGFSTVVFTSSEVGPGGLRAPLP